MKSKRPEILLFAKRNRQMDNSEQSDSGRVNNTFRTRRAEAANELQIRSLLQGPHFEH
jgi:hypothetical protein